MRDLVFINWRTGEPAKNSSYDTHLYKLCDEYDVVMAQAEKDCEAIIAQWQKEGLV